jgi:hypothetical protein
MDCLFHGFASLATPFFSGKSVRAIGVIFPITLNLSTTGAVSITFGRAWSNTVFAIAG